MRLLLMLHNNLHREDVYGNLNLGKLYYHGYISFEKYIQIYRYDVSFQSLPLFLSKEDLERQLAIRMGPTLYNAAQENEESEQSR